MRLLTGEEGVAVRRLMRASREMARAWRVYADAREACVSIYGPADVASWRALADAADGQVRAWEAQHGRVARASGVVQ